MVGRDNHERVVPVAVGFYPTNDAMDCFLATINRTDGVIEIIGVEREIDVAGFDEQGKRLVGLPLQSGQGSLGHLYQGGLLVQVRRAVRLGRTRLAVAIETGARIVVSVGGLVREMIEPAAAENAK